MAPRRGTQTNSTYNAAMDSSVALLYIQWQRYRTSTSVKFSGLSSGQITPHCVNVRVSVWMTLYCHNMGRLVFVWVLWVECKKRVTNQNELIATNRWICRKHITQGLLVEKSITQTVHHLLAFVFNTTIPQFYHEPIN